MHVQYGMFAESYWYINPELLPEMFIHSNFFYF